MNEPTILKETEFAIDRQELANILEELKQKEAEFKALYDGVIQMFAALGLADEKGIKIEAFQEGGNWLALLIKGGTNTMMLATKASGPKWAGGREAEKEIKEKFSFFEKLAPIFEKYSQKYNS